MSSEEEGLVQRPPALLGLKFRDEEDRELVRRVSLSMLGLVAMSILLFVMNLVHKGHFLEGFGHLILALMLPILGYIGVLRKSPRLVWCFHLGNVQYAIFHFVMGCVMLMFVSRLESFSPEKVCAPLNPQTQVPVGVIEDPAYQAEVAEQKEYYLECLHDVKAKQEHTPAKLFWWMIITAPLWACSIYAAYQSHEYYFRLRMEGLIVRTSGDGHATVSTEEANQTIAGVDADAVE
mmetsp:Transcript_148478/g.262139  ORF Transcript_148478/g.262139 Transcript_148478/m.262139 type:complete len:235 (-) Transcript_148478:105-809(-)